MKNFQLSLITQNQSKPEKAAKVAALIKRELEFTEDPELIKYWKFPNSYRITFSGQFRSGGYIAAAVELSSRLASPWLLHYHRKDGDLSMTFNTSETCSYGRQEFNVICWGSLETS